MLKNFFKKYAYYVAAFVLVLAVGVAAGLSGEGVPPPDIFPDDTLQTSTLPVQMVCPMKSAEVLKDYSDTELFYNATLKQWESHKGVDLVSSVSGDVFAALDGVVKSCSYSYENGYCITIEHDNGLSTIYCSLKSCDVVKEGDKINKGQRIGEVSSSASNEVAEGDHLHFQVLLNGKNVDPSNYLTLENK